MSDGSAAVTVDLGEGAQSGASEGMGRGFWTLLAASFKSNLGDGMSITILPLIAASLTDSPSMIAKVESARQLPWLVLALPLGVLVDRIDRQRCAAIVNLAKCGVVILLAILALRGGLSIAGLGAIALVMGCLEVCYDIAVPSILPAHVRPERLAQANGWLSSAETTANYFLGRSVGALLFTGLSQVVAIFGNAGMYLLSSVVMMGVGAPTWTDKKSPPSGAKRSLWREVQEGCAFIWGHRHLRLLALMGAIGNFAFGAVLAPFVLFVTKEIGAPTWSFGVLQAAFAVGALCMGWQAGRIVARFGEWKVLSWSIMAIPVSIAMTPLFHSPFVVGAASLANGGAAALWNTISISYRQRVTPANLLGRATSVFRLVSWGAMPVGALAGGYIAELVGLSWLYVVFAAVAAINIPLVLVVVRRT